MKTILSDIFDAIAAISVVAFVIVLSIAFWG